MSLLNVNSNLTQLQNYFSDFNSLFFPETCVGCSAGLTKGEDLLCTRCLHQLPIVTYFDDNSVKERFLGRLPVKHAWAMLRFRKPSIVQHLLHQLKYYSNPDIGIRLGKLAGEQILKAKIIPDFDFIVPVPLHPIRERTRGYNQSAKFAEGLASYLGLRMNEKICKRVLQTKTQTKKTKEERWENVYNAFLVIDKDAVAEKKILLVDDVLTTGATIEACGQKLIESGCSELSVVCIAEAQ